MRIVIPALGRQPLELADIRAATTRRLGPPAARAVGHLAALGRADRLIGGECSTDRLRPILLGLDAACRDVGRDPASMRRSAGLMVSLTDEPFTIGHVNWAAGGLRGWPAELAAALRAFAAEGLDEVQLGIWPATPAAVETVGEAVARLDEDR